MKTKTNKNRYRIYNTAFFRRNWGAFSVGILATLLQSVSNVLVSYVMQLLIDASMGVEGAMPLLDILYLTVGALALFAFSFVLCYHSIPAFTARGVGRYKSLVFRRLSKKNISAFSGENTSLYISALSNDVNAVETNYLSNIFNIIGDLCAFAGALGLMLWYSPMLTGIGIALTLIPVVASLLAGNRVEEAERTLSEKNESYVSSLKDALNGFSVVKSFQAEEEMCEMFSQRVADVTRANIRRRKMQTLVSGLGNVAGATAQMGVFLVGAWMALAGYGVSGGVVIAFVNLMNCVVGPVGTLPRYFAEYRASQGLIRKLADALEQSTREEGASLSIPLTEGICVKNVSFSYDGEKQALRQVDATFEPGKKYAIVGASGSGKSTLLSLLMAGYGGYEGEITLDGQELRTVSTGSLYEVQSIVQQNVFVFNASIRDNITMFREFPEEQMERAIRLSGLSSLIEEKGAGYRCGENGCGLSGGEKQRISIARALLKNAQILLVDEATAALDAETAYQVTDAILGLRGITGIVVTHALDASLLRRYDCIYTMKNGEIVESGTFDRLIDRKGYFYSLYTVSQ
ncbi:MAG: ABC transporter ATP-binding protein [Clostridia bacterium]|nr:ABC transporter ATP-binding protein [Clostridia bacterium]